jgi:hypothetical protein
MSISLITFEQVTRVALDVGTFGRLGGQANVKGVAGIWKDLTNNVHFPPLQGLTGRPSH